MGTEQHDWNDWFRYASASDVGMRRSNNQDALAVQIASDPSHWADQGHLFLVADGMGAHAAGELASKLAADHIPLLYRKQDHGPAPERLDAAIRGANQEIFRRGQQNIDFHNMGTTCSVLLLLPQGAVVGHVGDSRVYRLRNGIFSQLTFDHSLVWEMQQGNGKPPGDDEAFAGIPKNVITRSLGPHPLIDVDLEGPFPIEVGDTFVLCSDGLTGPLSDGEIATIVGGLAPDTAAQMLVDLSNMHGGPDNITVVICQVCGSDMATTTNSSDRPLHRGNGQRQRRAVHPLIWGMACLFGLAGAVALVTQQTAWAVVLFGAAAASGVMGLSIRFNLFADSGVIPPDEDRLGKGPYRELDQLPAEELCQQLDDKIKASLATIDDRDWDLDWTEFERHRQAAEDFTASNRAGEALRSYAKAIHLLVSQARQQMESNS